jgi:hypothetical protein
LELPLESMIVSQKMSSLKKLMSTWKKMHKELPKIMAILEKEATFKAHLD